MSNNQDIILGIDPGLVKTGWGIVRKSKDQIEYISCGVVKTNSSDKMEKRLVAIYDFISELIANFSPNSVAMEQVFVNMNPKSTQKLIMARSVAFLAIAKSGHTVFEYTPNEIKKNVTGSGHASKQQIDTMVQKILKVEIKKNENSITPDSIDALSTAICHSFC
ncbi:crossover junction endodeoxyribonuclease RuvC [Alphaproteobacteria bacterium]|nr:crossover junction endodeoxyribonuclease RuvC [Alphaproteobacteria bacterium]